MPPISMPKLATMPPDVTPLPRRRRTQAERRNEAEQRLLESAMHLVSQKGVAGLTLGEVGETAGYSRALPAHHFGNKEGLLKALAAHIRNTFSSMNLGRTPKPRAGLDAILATATLYLERTSNRDTGARALYAIITEATISHGSLQEEVKAVNRLTLHFLESQIRIGIQQGELRADLNPAAQAAIIIGMLRGIAMLHLVDETVDMQAACNEVLKNLQLALRAN